MNKKPETERYYVRVSDIEARNDLIEMLENKGYTMDENDGDTRQEILGSTFPIMVNITDKEYGVLHTITSAAAASSSGKLIEIQDLDRII